MPEPFAPKAPGDPPQPLGDVYDPTSSPYGPQENGVDAAAGGADSSPLDNLPSGTREEKAAAERYMNRAPENDPAGEATQKALD